MFDVIIRGLAVGDKKTVRRVKFWMMVGCIYIGLNTFLAAFFVARALCMLLDIV